MGQRRRRFTSEVKIEAVRLAAGSDKDLAAIARELGIRPDMLRKWRRQYAQTVSACAAFPGSGKVTRQDEELRRLKRELEVVREVVRKERDFLRAAAAISRRSPGEGEVSVHRAPPDSVRRRPHVSGAPGLALGVLRRAAQLGESTGSARCRPRPHRQAELSGLLIDEPTLARMDHRLEATVCAELLVDVEHALDLVSQDLRHGVGAMTASGSDPPAIRELQVGDVLWAVSAEELEPSGDGTLQATVTYVWFTSGAEHALRSRITLEARSWSGRNRNSESCGTPLCLR